MTISGSARDHGVALEVGPAGALRALQLSPEALQLGRYGLATLILDLVRKASAEANQRARHALRHEVRGLGEADFAALGMAQDPSLTEVVEATTPDTWRV
ncbi:hypothetical protein [Amycolatopsis nigrescens]|uniref:hypothetical protein n=1 Tax=Amycolatopsis nigrescens TaxID=381445 RepID=UPI000361E7A1|nr:hypothetical protein [Amycolatopsis nigrescens]